MFHKPHIIIIYDVIFIDPYHTIDFISSHQEFQPKTHSRAKSVIVQFN